MKLIFFTKMFKGYAPDKLIAFAKEQGLDGFDLAVRPGHPITEENISKELPGFVKRCRGEGLDVPMATVGLRALPVGEKATEAAWAACRDSGVGGIKLGYWVWEKTRPWREQFDEVKRKLEGYAKLSLKYGVKSLFHTHSGPYFGVNASALAHLFEGLDPKGVGAYLDFAHLMLNGEPPAMAIATAGRYLAMVAAKNVRWVAGASGGEVQGRIWKPEWCMLEDGLADWPRIVGLLREAGYDGNISLHGEYDHRHCIESVLEFFALDVKYMRAAVGRPA
jgi:sugar phosphate isomerase/epimerase